MGSALCCFCVPSSRNQVKSESSYLINSSYKESISPVKKNSTEPSIVSFNGTSSTLTTCGAQNHDGLPCFSDDESDGECSYFNSDNSDVDEDHEIKFLDEFNPKITIQVPPGPCGIQLHMNNAKYPEISFVRLPDGARGPIELSGKIFTGYALVGCNEYSFENKELRVVLECLSRHSKEPRNMHFRRTVHKYDDL